MQRILKTYPFFTFLLSIFFIFHAYTENYNFVPLKDAAIILLKYLAFSAILFFLFRIFLKNNIKTGLLIFFILIFHLFFGNLYDFIKQHVGNSILTKYTFILPASFILLLVLIIYLKKTKNSFSIFTHYLNWLFLLLILLDIGNILIKSTRKAVTNKTNLSDKFIICDTCSKPDVYLIVADEYAGQEELKDIFNYDNSFFLNELKKRNYHVTANSRGNYNFTHYSIASMLHMNYLEDISGDHSSSADLSISLNTLRRSNVVNFLKKQGYKFYNYSIFDINNELSPTKNSPVPKLTSPITSQTFLTRIEKDLSYHLLTTFKLKNAVNKVYYADLYNNETIYNLTKTIASQKISTAKFVYAHLVMPHYRYYFDSAGNKTPAEKIVNDNYCADKNAYLEYLKYSNGKLLTLIDHIKSSSKNPPIIILMSDHGYHQFLNEDDIKSVNKKYYFMTLNAVYFPDQNYSQYYDSLSNVNQFRIIFNSQFGQALPLLKDSTIFLAQ